MLRRVIENVKTQNWFAVALEFLIVVLSIFFALQVNNWNEARKDRIDERRSDINRPQTGSSQAIGNYKTDR